MQIFWRSAQPELTERARRFLKPVFSMAPLVEKITNFPSQFVAVYIRLWCIPLRRPKTTRSACLPRIAMTPHRHTTQQTRRVRRQSYYRYVRQAMCWTSSECCFPIQYSLVLPVLRRRWNRIRCFYFFLLRSNNDVDMKTGWCDHEQQSSNQSINQLKNTCKTTLR